MPINWRLPENFFEDHFFGCVAVFLASSIPVLGLERACPWPREGLSLQRLSLASEFFWCPWPWPRALCPRLHLSLYRHWLSNV